MLEHGTLVTIGIPTYQRPDLLARALESVACQTYRESCVLVSDNGAPGPEVEDVVESYRDRIPGLVLIRQPVNIGAIENFFFLLDQAQTEYFMWLADDDEISDTYVESLIALLESDERVVTAAGNWYYMQPDGRGELLPSRDYTSDWLPGRLAKYLWRADDAFFYGLHRTKVLRQASFKGYIWPNRDDARNFAYVYLLDMVLRGKVQVHPDKMVRFINHEYTLKSYPNSDYGLAPMIKYAMRRLNVHALYLAKIADARGFLLVLPLAFVSFASLLKEAASGLRLRICARFDW